MSPGSIPVRAMLTLAAAALCVANAGAQVTEVARTPIGNAAQLTFGYLCDDRFVIRNDGTSPVDLEYSIAKSNEHTKLTINGRETVELASPSKQAMELWVDGKLVARAQKEKRSCKDVQGNANFAVEPLDVRSSDQSNRSNRAYGFGAPFFDPWMSGMYGYYGGLGLRGWYPGFGYGFARSFSPVVIVRGGGRRGR